MTERSETAPIQGSPAEQLGWAVVREKSREAYNEEFVTCGAAILSGGANEVDVGSLVGVADLGPGGTPDVAWEFPKRSQWRGAGRIQFRLIYSSDTAGGAFRTSFRAAELAAGELLTKTPELSLTVDLAGPANANECTEYTYTTPLTINGDGITIPARIARDGAHANDTNSGDLYIIGLYGTYKELL